MEKTVYIVTGAAGHLGGYVVQALLNRGNEVRAFVLPGESCLPFAERSGGLLTHYTGDVRKRETLDQLFESDGDARFIVIHCAGIVSISVHADQRVYDVNVNGTANVVDACAAHHAKRLVYVSSVHAIPLLPFGQDMKEIASFDPDAVTGHYAKTKAAATRLVLDAAGQGLDALIVHPAGIIGPRGLPTGNMAYLISSFISGRLPAAIRGGFDFVDVRDVARGILLAAEKGRSGECYILSNRFIDLRELFDTLSEVAGKKKLRLYLPLWAAKAVAPFMECYYSLFRKTPLFTRYSLLTVTRNAAYSHEKATRELGYSTRPLKETLSDIVQWLKQSKAPKAAHAVN
ncbi:MAG TPA: NAD-dependent epimerase/dehydratase family protein [Feifaniaceae bacterium]|nr:NAD-dependent epimerase/dehydratase family protein [Feifaniaceae bacterium]